MALQQTIVFNTGVSVTNSYSRIDNVFIRHSESSGSPINPNNVYEVRVYTYKDQSSFQNGSAAIAQYNYEYSYDPSANLTFESFYDLVKQETLFVGSSDV